MSWNYRVIETTEPDGTKCRAIHEVYYTRYKKGGSFLTGYSEKPAVVLDDSDDPTAMFKILIMMGKGLCMPVLIAKDLQIESGDTDGEILNLP